jgi:FKBP-type peptidyl-prolyl cis-trans isomerase
MLFIIMKDNYITLILSFALVLFASCEKDEDERPSDEMIRFNAYMQVNHPSLSPTQSGLYYSITSNGSGIPPVAGDYILFDYSIQNLDGKMVETTMRQHAWLYDILSNATNYTPVFRMHRDPLRPLIEGVAEGLSLMTPGDTARLFMPSSIAYASKTYKGLPPYSSVICDIVLHGVYSDPNVYEQELISKYLANNYPNISIGDTTNGIYFLEVELGSGNKFKDEDNVAIYYAGSFTHGFIFDTNIREVAQQAGTYNAQKTYNVLNVRVGSTDFIEGFSEMLRELTPESTAKVLIPSKKAYGVAGTNTIFPYTPLVFDITISTVDEEDEEDDK